MDQTYINVESQDSKKSDHIQHYGHHIEDYKNGVPSLRVNEYFLRMNKKIRSKESTI
jgi:hypothetical protein